MGPLEVERFLRVSITFGVAAWFGMLALTLLSVGHWALWVPGLVACSGVIVSFAVHLNHSAFRRPTPRAIAG